MKILLIDDSREDRDLIITHIKKSKSRQEVLTEESNCLKDAFKKLDGNNYDVIILDLVLPESDGVETVKKILAHLEMLKKNIPVIVLTGMEDYKVGREIWLLGIKDYLIKDEIQSKDLSRALNFATYKQNIRKKSILI